jgi:hypothetical protein
MKKIYLVLLLLIQSSIAASHSFEFESSDKNITSEQVCWEGVMAVEVIFNNKDGDFYVQKYQSVDGDFYPCHAGDRIYVSSNER